MDGSVSDRCVQDLVIRNGVLAEDLVIEGNWRYSQELMNQYACAGELYITQDLYIRRIVSEPRHKTLKDLLPRVGTDETASHRAIDLLDLFADGWGSNEDAEEELRTLMSIQGLMEFTKPRKLIEKLVASLRDPDGMILDFFAGSCTTAHAVMDLNRLDSGARCYIMVQLPEPTYEIKDGKKVPKRGHEEAFRAGYETIAEIGKERIRRVIKKIEEELNPQTTQMDAEEELFKDVEENNLRQSADSLDLGFKVFKLDASNIKPWDADFDDVEGALLSAVENIKPDRSEADVLYELLLKYGLDLAVPIEERSIGGRTVHIIGAGALIVCLAKDITLEVVEGIAALKEELKPEVIHVVFKDSGFADDIVKTNAVQILRQAGIEDVKSL